MVELTAMVVVGPVVVVEAVAMRPPTPVSATSAASESVADAVAVVATMAAVAAVAAAVTAVSALVTDVVVAVATVVAASVPPVPVNDTVDVTVTEAFGLAMAELLHEFALSVAISCR